MDGLGNHIIFLPLDPTCPTEKVKIIRFSDSTRLLHNQRLWSQCLQLLLPVDAAEIMAGSKPLMFATRLSYTYTSTGYHSTNTEVVEPSAWKVSCFSQKLPCCCGMFGNFPQNCQKRTQQKQHLPSCNPWKNTLVYLVVPHLCLLVKPLHLLVFQGERSFTFTASLESPETTFRPASEVPKFLPIEQSLAKLCPTNCSSSHGSWVSFSCHGNTRGKFRQVYAIPMGIDGLMPFWGVQWGPLGEEKL